MFLKRNKMETVKELEQKVSNLSPNELAEFRKWYEEFDAEVWDKQFEEDVKAGKLDHLAQQALKDFECKEIPNP